MNNFEWIVGIDLCEGVSQLSCFDMEKMEPGTEEEIPAVLLRLPDGSWLAGAEAENAAQAGEGTLVRGFLTDPDVEPELHIGEEIFSKTDLIAEFLGGILKAKQGDASSKVYLTVTVRKTSPALCTALLTAREKAGAAENTFSIMSHMLSAEFYALSQKRELWLHDVGIFEYDTAGLRYEHLSISGQKHPAIVHAGLQDLSSFLNGSELSEESGIDRDAAFLAALEASAGEVQVSTFYLVGEGFRDIGEGSSWMKRSLQELCAKRRHVFVGQNFYVKGACYNSYYMAIPQARPEFVAADTELTTEDIFLYISQNGKLARLPLIPLQTAWFTAEGTAAVLPDGTQELLLGVQNAVTGETRRYPIPLEGMPQRPAKTTKLLVYAKYAQEQVLQVRVQDMGFGDLFPAAGKTWEMEIDLDAEEVPGMARSLPGKSSGRVLETTLPGNLSPLQIPRTGWMVYAFDELCWYVKENVSALDKEFFDERLFRWLDGLSGSSRFSDSLRRMKEEDRPMADLVRFLFSASDYISPAEQKEAAAALAALEKQDASERAGMVADYYYRYGRYMSAALQYQHAIWLSEHDEQASSTRGFRSGLWHNMGLALLRLGDRESAVQCLQKAFQEKEDVTLVSECLSIQYMSGDEKAFRELAEKYRISDGVLSSIREACDKAGMEYENSERAAKLEEMLAQQDKDTILEYLEKAKKRYAI